MPIDVKLLIKSVAKIIINIYDTIIEIFLNNFGDKQYMALDDHIVKIIESHDGSTILSLANCGFRDKDIKEIIQRVNSNPKILALNLGCNNFRSEGIKELTTLQNVRLLDVSQQNDLNDEAAIELIRTANFRSLNLSGNRGITDIAGLIMLDEASQITLNLDITSISSNLCEKISERIASNLQRFKEKNKRAYLDKKSNSVASDKGIFAKAEDEIKEKTTAVSPSLLIRPSSKSG